MSNYQLLTLILGVLGFALTWTLVVVGAVKAVESIKQDTAEKVATASKALLAQIEALRNEFHADQKSQDHSFGEVGAAMRQYTADVEKKLREVEIYGRDNYVKIPDFEKAIDRMGETIRAAVAEIKEDMRQLLKTPPN